MDRDRRPVPSGTVTFLFTDIEGSTQRWDAFSEAMQAMLRTHDRLLRSAIEAHGGFVFKTMGDAFCAAFARAECAVLGAVAAQRALAAEDFSNIGGLRVRMALHTGTADERDDDYFGPTVNRVARLLAIGHGGQVLVSDRCAGLARPHLPSDVTLVDVGRHRLKDLVEPESVAQVAANDLVSSFPALRSMDNLRSNLPQQLTSFVGRASEVAEVEELIATHRLVTFVGVGGVGKTRLAMHVGAELIDAFTDGVWVAQLASISDPTLVTNIIASALALQESINRPLLESVLIYLKHKNALLIVDNCEHLVGEAANVVDIIVRNCPNVSILATSREALGIAGERRYRMPSLPTVEPWRLSSAADALTFGSIALFVDRAREGDPNFIFTDEEVRVVAEVCLRLDGIALAIELAAARVKTLPLVSILERLDERFRLLTGGSRVALPRQQTLRAMVDWSYDLLTDTERALFDRLAVFTNEFSPELAIMVCADALEDRDDVLDVLESLTEKSLVVAIGVGSGRRFRLLESIRQYAYLRLAARGELERYRNAHADGYAALAERFAERWYETPDRQWDATSERELSDWRAALAWTLCENGRRNVGCRIAAALRQVFRRVSAVEGRRWVKLAIGSIDLPTERHLAARLYVCDAMLAGALELKEAFLTSATRAYELFDALDDRLGSGEARMLAGGALAASGDLVSGEALIRGAIASFREQRLPRLVGLGLGWLGRVRREAGDRAEHRAILTEAMEIERKIGAFRLVAVASSQLARLEFEDGRTTNALSLANEALAIFSDLRYPHYIAGVLLDVAEYEAALGAMESAKAHARESLTHARDCHDDIRVVKSLGKLAAFGAIRPLEASGTAVEAMRRSATLIGFVARRQPELDAFADAFPQREWHDTEALARRVLGDDVVTRLLEEGRDWTEERAIAEALAI